MSLQNILINTSLSVNGFNSVCPLSPGKFEGMESLVNYFAALTGGNQMALLQAKVGMVQATGTIVQASTGAAHNQTLTILGVTFTAKTNGATGNQWNRSDTVATSATNLAAAINASADVNIYVTALASSGTVTLTVIVPGIVGNKLVMANGDCANTTVNSFANGSNGTSYSFDFS